MANYHEHECFTCGRIFDYCRRCVITPVVYKAEGFCSESCSHVFNTLSKHDCKLISADEAFLELAKYDLDKMMLKDNIIEHIKLIESELTINTEANEPEDEADIESDEE